MSELLRDRVVSAIGSHYELGSEIGRGGTSVVYRARDLRLNRPVAIKVLPPELAYDPAIRSRFTREAQTSAQLSHPHIVQIHDVGEREGLAYFVMALVTGGSLGTLLAREPRQPIDRLRHILCEIADALAYAHQRGVVHRDIKPDNILLEQDGGRAMVTDFGIARAIEGGTRLTVTGLAVGTPTYMSPEQALGERELDGRSDIYSLGVLAYQMVTGRVPFGGGNSMALLFKHVNEPPRPITELRPDAPRALCNAIERALMKAPEDRWPTAAALSEALTSDDVPAPWRPEPRAPVRLAPAPEPAAERPRSAIALEPGHLASLTPAQREDLRLWHGRVNLRDRINAARGYLLLTVGTFFASFGAFAAGMGEGIPPLVFAPIVPLFMARKLWRRGKSLREAGLKLRRVFLMPRARWVIPAPAVPPTERQLEKVAPREILDGPQGAAIRVAAEERAAILDIVAQLPKRDRALVPDVAPTVNALFERVAHLAQTLHRLDHGFDPRLIRDLDGRIAQAERESASPDGQRRLALFRRQRATLEDLTRRRDALARQLDSAGLALANLRLDLIKLRSSGLESALSDVSTATQEARALSREIGAVLDAAAEVRGL
jgi:serine/threonine-protein kinase